MRMNRRRWLARAAACASAGSAFEFQLAAESTSTPQLPARVDFPMAESSAFLNNAAWHPLSKGAMGAIQTYLRQKSTGSTRVSFAPAGEQVKAAIARLIHVPPSSLGFVPSTTIGENLIVAGLGFPHTQGNIVTDALHYENSTILYRSLQAQGVDVRFVKPREGRIELAGLDKAIDRNTKLVAISLVSYLNGFEYDLKAVCDLAHSKGAYVYADLVQGAGSVPIDVEAAGADFCGGGSHKWLMADFGLGYLYVREDLLDKVMRRTQYGSRQVANFENHIFPYDATADGAATWKPLNTTAAHFEVGTMCQATIAALSYSLPYIERLGVANIQAHVQSLTSRLQKEMPRLGYPSATPPETRSAIVSFVVKDPRALSARLEKANVDAKIEQHLLRVSPSVYNNQADIDRLLNALS